MIPGLVNIRKVMDQTGGEMFDVQDVAHLDSIFRALIQRIKTRYTLGYYTNANGAEGKPHKLDVRLASSFGKKGRDYSFSPSADITFIEKALQNTRRACLRRRTSEALFAFRDIDRLRPWVLTRPES